MAIFQARTRNKGMLALMTVLVTAAAAQAEDSASPEARAHRSLEVQAGLGVSRMTGDMSGNLSRPMTDISLIGWRDDVRHSFPWLGGITGFVQVDLAFYGAFSASSSAFDLQSGTATHLNRSSLGIGLCALSDQWARLCLAIDYGTVAMSQGTGTMVNEGTSAVKLAVKHVTDGRITYGVTTEILAITEKVAGLSQYNGFLNTELTIGWLF